MRAGRIRVSCCSYSGDTKVVSFPSVGRSLTETNVSVCKVCPSSRIGGSTISLGPTLRLIDRVDFMGSIRGKASVDCNKAFITPGRVQVTAVPIKCNSKCPHSLSGGNCILVRKGHTSVMKEIYVSRFVMSMARVPRTGFVSPIALIKGSGSTIVHMRSLSSLDKEFGCRFIYSLDGHIPERCCGGNAVMGRVSCFRWPRWLGRSNWRTCVQWGQECFDVFLRRGRGILKEVERRVQGMAKVSRYR